MRDVIYEESVSSINEGRENSVKKILLVIIIIEFAVGVYFLINFLWQINVYLAATEENKSTAVITLIGQAVFCVLFIGLGALFIHIRGKFGISFDYEFMSGDLRISRASKNKRTPLYTIRPEEFLKVGKVSSNAYFDLKRNKSLRETRFTKNKTPAEGKDFYYILYADHLGKQIFIIECREEMIRNISLYAARGTVEL